MKVAFRLTLVFALAWTAGALRAEVDPKEGDRLAELLSISAGSRVADVGAGHGEWSFDLARRVGPSGQVFATEVDPDRLKEIRERATDRGLTNVSIIWGDQKDSGLPPGCCDAILMREVYHHFTDPAAMRASFLRALRPAGLLAVIDFEPGSRGLSRPAGVPENRAGHGIARSLLIREMIESGFTVVSEHPDWQGRSYCVLFRRRTPSTD